MKLKKKYIYIYIYIYILKIALKLFFESTQVILSTSKKENEIYSSCQVSLGENKTSLKCENKIHEKLKLKNQNEKE